MSDHRTRFKLLLLTAVISLLISCAQTPKKVPAKPKPPSAQLLLLNDAVAREASGDFSAAAALFETLATRSPAPQREQFWVRAANAYLQANDSANAEATLARAERALLNPEMAFLARLIDAKLALDAARLEAAQALLAPPPPLSASISVLSRYRELRAELFRRRGNFLDSARERAALDALLPDRQQRLANQVTLLRTLSAISDEDLLTRRPSPPNAFSVWMELALSIRAHTAEAPRLANEFDQWRLRHPQHPALPELLGAYQATLTQLRATYRHIAVLLPISGRYAKAALALQDGLLNAYYASAPERRPRLTFYDSSNTDETWPLLQQAIADGAEAAIGPLQKEAVQQLAEAGELAIPVLTLNRIKLERTPPTNLFQFGLAPEDEAQQAARQAWQDGASGAVVLLPNSEWGQRLLESFQQQWESLGGILAGQQVYDQELNDFSEPIRTLLHLDASKQREQALARELRQSLEFQPRRRQDAQALFLIANARKARSIWPQLQFHHAGDLPTYTTSQIYDGTLNMPQDLDLAGLMFTDIPWLLKPPAAGSEPPQSPPRTGVLARLFALGMDSYRLLAELPRLKEFPASSYPGDTGQLSLDALNQVHRELVWARINNAGLELIGQPPTDTQAPPEAHMPPQPARPTQTQPTQTGHVSAR